LENLTIIYPGNRPIQLSDESAVKLLLRREIGRARIGDQLRLALVLDLCKTAAGLALEIADFSVYRFDIPIRLFNSVQTRKKTWISSTDCGNYLEET